MSTALAVALCRIGARELAKAEWDETKHPRGASGPGHSSGEFAPAGGGGEGRPYGEGSHLHPKLSQQIREMKGPRSNEIREAASKWLHAVDDRENAKAQYGESSVQYDTAAELADHHQRLVQEKYDQRKKEIAAQVASRPTPEGEAQVSEEEAARRALAVTQRQSEDAKRKEEAYWRQRMSQEEQIRQSQREREASGSERPTAQPIKPGRWSSSLFDVASRIAAASASISDIMGSVATVATARDFLTIGRELNNLSIYSNELKGHIEEAPAEFGRLHSETKLKLQDARDTLLNTKDHIVRLRHKAMGDSRAAGAAARRITVRTRQGVHRLQGSVKEDY